MPNIFFGLNIGRSALLTHQTALDVTGHNLANVKTEGYSRQRAALAPGRPTPTPQGPLGSGVEASRVERLQVGYLERQIAKVTVQNGYDAVLSSGLEELQSVLGEPSSEGLSAALTEFWNSWDALAARPTDAAIRGQVLDRAEHLATVYNQKVDGLMSLEDRFDEALSDALADVNARAKELADLNASVQKSEAAGYPANDLRDQRDRLVRQIAQKIDVEVSTQGALVNLRLSGDGPFLVNGPQAYEISARADARGHLVDLRVESATVTPSGGEIGGLLELRDELSPGLRDDLSKWMATVAGRVNALHTAGVDRDGTPGRNLFVWSGDGSRVTLSASEGTAAVNISSNLEPGTHHLEVVSVAPGLAANTRGTLSAGAINLGASGAYNGPPILNLDYHVRVIRSNADPASLDGLRLQLFRGDEAAGPAVEFAPGSGASAGAVALGTVDGVAFTADVSAGGTSGFVAGERSNGRSTVGEVSLDGSRFPLFADLTTQNNLTFAGGTSHGFLGGGTATVNFSGSPFARASFTVAGGAANLSVDSIVAADTDKLAAAQAPAGGGEPAIGDGETARRIADLATRGIFEEIDETPSGFMSRVVQSIGSKGRDAKVFEEAGKSVLLQLEAQRESVSGVNVDEEMVQLLQFQRGFEAAARFLTTVDSLIETLINRVGLVGR